MAVTTPASRTDDANALTNGAMLPVVLSINCSSGAFQDDDTSFATQAARQPERRRGRRIRRHRGLADVTTTRSSPSGSWTRSCPRVLAGEGPADRQRVGEALIYGKSRLAGIWPPSGPGITGGDGGTRNEFYLWHYFGDPSMQMWGGEPVELPDLSRFEAVVPQGLPGPAASPIRRRTRSRSPCRLSSTARPSALLRDGQVIGKAIAADGRAQIPAAFGDGTPTQGDLRVAMEADGAVPVSVPVDGLPVATKLTTSCPASPQASGAPMATSGTLEPGFAGAQIILRYTPPAGQPFERTVTTNANGNWSDKITPSDGNPPNNGAGVWQIEPRYEGDVGHAAASGQACLVTVT